MERINHYKINERLGSGAMGMVYKAFDTMLERHVAIKVMHGHLLEDKKNDDRFMREARAVAKLVHPNIVTIYEVGEAECGRYIVMEYVQGESLKQFIGREKKLSPQRAAQIILQVLDGLECAHKIGILHRDIKPDNILVTHDEKAKILDFGIAKMTAMKGLTASGDLMGTVQYMAPEQMLGEDVDRRCDIYSLGVVFYELLTHHLPFDGDNPVAVLYKQLNEEPVPPSHYNEAIFSSLEQAIMKSIQRQKENRWESAGAFGEVLRALFQSNNFAAAGADATLAIHSEIDAQAGGAAEDPDRFRSVFVGRDREFKKLVDYFGMAVRGQGQTVVVSGEAGVGKTTLVSRLQEYAHQNKAWALYGASLYQDGMDAYLPYIDAFRGFFSNDSYSLPEAERIKLKEVVREKVPLLMEFTERFSTTFGPINRNGSSGPFGNNFNLLEGIHYLISTLAGIRPTLLVLDDIQWADEASLRLFHYLSRHVTRNRVLLLGITRTDRYDLQQNGKPAPIVDILARMRREGSLREVAVKRLRREECDKLIDESLSNTLLTEEFYESIFRETRGNPFFVLETLKLLRDQEHIYLKDGVWYDRRDGFKVQVPTRVEDVFIRQLSELNDEEREILQVASVIGYKFDISLLSKMLEMSKVKLLKVLQKVEKDLEILFATENGYQFEHPMLKDLLYNEIPAPLRREYHLMIAAELEQIYGEDLGAMVGEVAQHFHRGKEYARAVPLLYQAALRAFKLSAYREASMLFEDLIQLQKDNQLELPSSISPTDLYLKSGICLEETGEWERSLQRYEELLALSEKENLPKSQIEALMRIGRMYDKKGEWDTAIEKYEQFLEIAEVNQISNFRSRAFNNLGVIYYQKGDLEKAMNYFKKTLEAVDSEMGIFDKAHALTSIGIICNTRGKFDDALQSYNEALAIYEQKNHSKYQARVHHNMGVTFSDMGDWDKAIAAYEKCLELAGGVEDRHLRALTFVNIAKVQVKLGNLAQARRLAEKALKIFKRLNDDLSVADAYMVFGLIYGAQENFTRAEKFFRESVSIHEGKNFQEGVAESSMHYGSLCRDFGYVDRAREFFSKAEKAYRSLHYTAKAEEVVKLAEGLSIENGR